MLPSKSIRCEGLCTQQSICWYLIMKPFIHWAQQQHGRYVWIYNDLISVRETLSKYSWGLPHIIILCCVLGLFSSSIVKLLPSISPELFQTNNLTGKQHSDEAKVNKCHCSCGRMHFFSIKMLLSLRNVKTPHDIFWEDSSQAQEWAPPI